MSKCDYCDKSMVDSNGVHPCKEPPCGQPVQPDKLDTVMTDEQIENLIQDGRNEIITPLIRGYFKQITKAQDAHTSLKRYEEERDWLNDFLSGESSLEYWDKDIINTRLACLDTKITELKREKR